MLYLLLHLEVFLMHQLRGHLIKINCGGSSNNTITNSNNTSSSNIEHLIKAVSQQMLVLIIRLQMQLPHRCSLGA